MFIEICLHINSIADIFKFITSDPKDRGYQHVDQAKMIQNLQDYARFEGREENRDSILKLIPRTTLKKAKDLADIRKDFTRYADSLKTTLTFYHKPSISSYVDILHAKIQVCSKNMMQYVSDDRKPVFDANAKFSKITREDLARWLNMTYVPDTATINNLMKDCRKYECEILKTFILP
jgi:hypothetical protein